MDDETQFIIRKLRIEDPVNISSGSPSFGPLKIFLKRQAKQFQTSRIAITYIVGIADNDNNEKIIKTIGYITITNSEIDVQESYSLTDCPHANKYSSLPAIKIARLMMDSHYRGNRIGTHLINHVLTLISDEIAPRVGCRFLITDAKQDAISFYEKIGFSLLDTDNNKAKPEPIMFLDLYKLNGD